MQRITAIAFSLAIIVVFVSACAVRSNDIAVTKRAPKVGLPKGWETSSRSDAEWTVLSLKRDSVHCWTAQAEISSIPLSKTEWISNVKKLEGLGIPNVFEVLDERQDGDWTWKLMMVKESDDVFIQLMGFERGGIVCNLRISSISGCTRSEAETSLSRLNGQLVALCSRLGFGGGKLVFIKNGLLRIGDGWGVTL